MSDNASDSRNQFAVLWPATGFNDYGEATVGSSEEIKVRIEKELEDTIDAQGNKVASDMRINVPKQITVGSIIWVGKLTDLPSPTTDLHQVISYEEVPDVDAVVFDRWVQTMKYKDTLPSA